MRLGRVCILVLAASRFLLSDVRGDDSPFSRDVRPILSDACFPCHGADKAKRTSDLRLDQRTGLFSTREGRAIVTPGQPDASELVRRIESDDLDERMPPPDADRQLTKREIEMLRSWVASGVKWQEHWAFVVPSDPRIPMLNEAAADRGFLLNPIDAFVAERLNDAGLRHSETASRTQQATRASLTLTGLPLSHAHMCRYLDDASPMAYERLVDRLLASPRYGEHAALTWLDLARYADTDGYQDDQPRVMWRWRDWLIDSLNSGMSFDEFTTDLLAGDLRPNATDWQRLGTGFHRNHRTNGEGGSIAEEFRVEYVADCVETTATVWLGLTIGCCRCHDHKYDPFSQRDFYRLFAYFNNTPEKGVYRGNGSPPLLKVPTRDEQRTLDTLAAELARIEPESERWNALNADRQKIMARVVSTMVMADGKPRETFVLERGQYNAPGEKVRAGVPRLFKQPAESAPRNRLTLARWLFQSANPLTGRVAANRIWSGHFGTGLVRTPEDFGSQGDRPSHPALLDWLSVWLAEHDWQTKRLHQLIVTSGAFRQASSVNDVGLASDPKTRLLWRFPRWRMRAESIRDRAMAVSGLLVEQLGGPSVKPYQPKGLWDEIAGGSTSAYKGGYRRDVGAALYRRSLYTFWRRTIPPPSMSTFDAPSRETCTVRRPRTNTPLQALTLMNDVGFLEAARALGARMMDGGDTTEERAAWGFELALSRRPTDEERKLLVDAAEHYLKEVRRNPEAAEKLTSVGEFPVDKQRERLELAAFMVLGNVLLNLDEFLTVE